MAHITGKTTFKTVFGDLTSAVLKHFTLYLLGDSGENVSILVSWMCISQVPPAQVRAARFA